MTTNDTAPTFTKTEALRRLRRITATIRDIEGSAFRCRVEIGTRTSPVRTLSMPLFRSEVIADDDDLSDFVDLKTAAADDEISGPGMIVHVYIYATPTGFGEYELTDVHTAWMGRKDADPVVILRTGDAIAVR